MTAAPTGRLSTSAGVNRQKAQSTEGSVAGAAAMAVNVLLTSSNARVGDVDLTATPYEVAGGDGSKTLQAGKVSVISLNRTHATVKANASALLGADQVFMREIPSMGVEDFAYFAAARPACFFHLGAGTGDPRHDIAHSCFYDLDESCIPIGICLQALNVLNYRG